MLWKGNFVTEVSITPEKMKAEASNKRKVAYIWPLKPHPNWEPLNDIEAVNSTMVVKKAYPTNSS